MGKLSILVIPAAWVFICHELGITCHLTGSTVETQN